MATARAINLLEAAPKTRLEWKSKPVNVCDDNIIPFADMEREFRRFMRKIGAREEFESRQMYLPGFEAARKIKE